MKKILATFLSGILIATISGVIVYHYTDIFESLEKYSWKFKDKKTYNVYFRTYEGKHRKSEDGFAIIQRKGKKVNIFETAEDLEYPGVKGKKHGEWSLTGYEFKDDTLFLSYESGIAILFKEYDCYIGYWIGKNMNGKLIKCPYVFSKDSMDWATAVKKWPILNEKCCEFNIFSSECNAIN